MMHRYYATPRTVALLSIISVLVVSASLALLPPVEDQVASAASPPQPSATLDVLLTVKENAGVATTAYPIGVVIPLPGGQYTSTAGLGIAGVPSQVEVLERWPGDNPLAKTGDYRSLRHVLVHFQPTVGANGQAAYHFTNGGRADPPVAVVVTDTAGAISVTTGPLKFVVSKTAFNILDQVWFDQNANGVYESNEQIISSDTQNGGVFVPLADACLCVYAQAGAPRYHIVWSSRPIVQDNSTDPAVINCWAANAIGPSLTPFAGAAQALAITTGNSASVTVAIFAFDQMENMNAISNVTQAEPGKCSRILLPVVIR